MKELHATVAALVYASVCTEPTSVWDPRSPMEKAIKAADDFVAGYGEELLRRGFSINPFTSEFFKDEEEGACKVPAAPVFDPTVTKKKPTPAEVVEDIKAKRRAAKGSP